MNDWDKLCGMMGADSADTVSREFFLATLRSQHVGTPLRDMFSSGNSSELASSSGPHSLPALVCTAHLSFLLLKGAGITDLLAPLPNASYGCALTEECLLQLAEVLHRLDYPIEVPCGSVVENHLMLWIDIFSQCLSRRATSFTTFR